ncbi:MAG: hypothetical protein DRH12_16795 [Deltaproteobacteria bacterium]|nr:MAG: hypothetical protein DRH12_16795 [Deltaproteobacteria bacterium]
MIKKAFALTVLGMFCAFGLPCAPGQASAQWAITCGTIAHDEAKAILRASDGGHVVLGQTWSVNSDMNFWIVKLDESGHPVWQKEYGGSGEDIPQSITSTSDGGYVVAASTRSFGAGESDIWVVKLNFRGEIEWQRSFGSTETEIPSDIQQTVDGGYIIAAIRSSSTYTGFRWWLLKLDSTGNIDWQKIYDPGHDGLVHSIQQTLDGGYIVAGTVYARNGDFLILGLKESGDIEWQKSFGLDTNGDEHIEMNPIIKQTSDGGFIVAGQSILGSQNQIWAAKLDASRNIEWQKKYSTVGDYVFTSLIEKTEGGYILGGWRGCIGGESGTQSFDGWIMEIDSSGDIQWQRTYGGPTSSDNDKINSIVQTPDGGYIAAGFTESFDLAGGDAWVLRLSEDGSLEGCAAVNIWSGNSSDTSEIGVEITVGVTTTGTVTQDTVVAAEPFSLVFHDGCKYYSNMVQLPETGQTTSYHERDDGALKTGVEWPAPRFTDNGDGTITDNLTGLMWLKDCACLGERPWEEALTTVSDLNSNPDSYSCQDYTASYRDWRMPNRKELLSMIDRSRTNPALPLGHPFVRISTDYSVWSSSTYAGSTGSAWSFSMRFGLMWHTSKSYSRAVWAVRSIPSECKADFDHDGDVDGIDLVVFAQSFLTTEAPEFILEMFAREFGTTSCPLLP